MNVIKYLIERGDDLSELIIDDHYFDQAGNLCIRRKNGTYRVVTVNDEPSLVKPEFKDACDVNLIIRRFQKTGVMSNIRSDKPFYGDFSSAVDYQTALNSVAAAQESFLSLPADVRKRFGNDPSRLLEFLDDPQNATEAVKLGLVNPPQDSKNSLGSDDQPNESATANV